LNGSPYIAEIPFEDGPMPGKAFCLTTLSILLLTAAWQPVQAASFDCTKAEAPDEEAVCADHHLNGEDAEMSVLYTQLKPLLGMGSHGDLDEAQVAWLKRRAGCGDDRICLSKAYADRILQLRGGFEALAKRSPS
jgi:uncharacterized protein